MMCPRCTPDAAPARLAEQLTQANDAHADHEPADTRHHAPARQVAPRSHPLHGHPAPRS